MFFMIFSILSTCQSSKMPAVGPGHCQVALEATPGAWLWDPYM